MWQQTNPFEKSMHTELEMKIVKRQNGRHCVLGHHCWFQLDVVKLIIITTCDE